MKPGHSLLLPLRLMLAAALCITVASPALAERPLRFTPLPLEDRKILLSQFRPMLDYLQRETGLEYQFRVYENYGKILQALQDDAVDLAYLGPLPYILLTREDADFEPLVRFLNAEGGSYYTCSLVAFGDNPVELADLVEQPIALTQPYSTCGYLLTETLLRRHGRSLAQNRFDYTGSHSESILSVVRGTHVVGAAKSSIVDKYRHLHLRVIAESGPLPGFLLVANTRTTTAAQRQRIRAALTGLKPLRDAAARRTTQDWGDNIRYGAIPARDADYEPIRGLYEALPAGIPGIQP